MKRYWKEPIPQNAPRLYRAEARIYGHHDEDFCSNWTSSRVEIERYFVVRKTPRGCWVAAYKHAPMHFIRDGAKKRFAWQTKLEALESLVARKEAEIWHLEGRLENARRKHAAAQLELRTEQAAQANAQNSPEPKS